MNNVLIIFFFCVMVGKKRQQLWHDTEHASSHIINKKKGPKNPYSATLSHFFTSPPINIMYSHFLALLNYTR